MTKKKETSIINLNTIIEITYRWAVASKIQIKRINENYQSANYENQVIRIADDHFLKISLQHLISWLEELEKYASYSKYTQVEDETNTHVSLAESLKEQCRGLHDYRNMAEHDIEYYGKIGRKQNAFINTEYNQSRLQPLVKDGDYLISGEISLKRLEPMIDEIVEVVGSRQFNAKEVVFEMNIEELCELLDGEILI